jgi:hypothetical protein
MFRDWKTGCSKRIFCVGSGEVQFSTLSRKERRAGVSAVVIAEEALPC